MQIYATQSIDFTFVVPDSGNIDRAYTAHTRNGAVYTLQCIDVTYMKSYNEKKNKSRT